MLHSFLNQLKSIPDTKSYGEVAEVCGSLVRVKGLPNFVGIGAQGLIHPLNADPIPAEVVGFEDGITLLMGYKNLAQVAPYSKVEIVRDAFSIFPSEGWVGRVINGFGEPLDQKGPLAYGELEYPVHNKPLPSFERATLHERLDFGVRALNTFTTCCEGQRLGIFAGSGVGKSVLMSQIARYSSADVNVIGLIGERGREVREFIENTLGEEGMAKTVLIVSTSDEPALMRRQASYLTMAVAEYFRDQGKQVLCMLDTVTRFAMALREIGLSIGEPPTAKGYTPNVFSELPKLLERAGPGHMDKLGSITGLFTVLVDGDDHNEPIADAVRGILDGHIVLDRSIAERNRFPAVNVLKSISRTMPDCNGEAETELIQKARSLLSVYEDMADMIRLGAYRQGGNPQVDEAIAKQDGLEQFLSQKKDEHTTYEEGFELLAGVLLSGDEAA